VAFYLLGSRSASNRLASALLITVIYTILFIPFTFVIDRFTYNRWQRRAEQQGQKGSARKR
jgi:succinate dehydrogenase hydrophobic anchor subunit